MLSRTLAAAFAGLFFLPAIQGAEHRVTVGGPGILKYDPQFVNAAPGDTVSFVFKQKNHTVTQSSFEAPCAHLDGGFDSGFVPVPDSNTDGPFPVAQFVVADTKPVWVYCKQGNHCQQGMVFAINPGDKFAAFQAAATGSTTAPPTTPTATTNPSVSTITTTVTIDGKPHTTTYGSFPGSAAPTAVDARVHVISVGKTGTLAFDPPNVQAQVGDTLVFQFLTKNHTVTQSTFPEPCSRPSPPGFDSGFVPIAAGASPVNFTVTVNDTAPIWVYCRQANHCAQGMVFAANAIESGPNNFAAFRAKAMGTAPPASSTGSTITSSGSQSQSQSTSTTTTTTDVDATQTAPPRDNGSARSTAGAGAIALAVAACVLGSLL